jgi:hypothetical protein
MASVDRKWVPLVLIGLAVVASLLAYRWLPPIVELRLGGLLPFDTGDASDPVPRWLALSLIPAIALVVWAAFRAAPTARGQRVGRVFMRGAPDEVTSPAQFARFGKTYDTIVLAVVLLLLGVHGAVIASTTGYPALGVRIIPMVLGLCLILMGNVMPRLRPNWVAGVRTKRTLEDPQLWRTTHRAFGTAFVLSGILTMAVGLMAPRFGLVTGIGSLAASCIVGLIASTRPRPMTSM